MRQRDLLVEKLFDDAEAVLRTALSIQQKLLGAENPEVATSLEALGYVAGSKGKLTEAEAHFHQCLAIREKNSPDNWQTFTARSLLGGNLLDQKKFAEAEPLLLSGYEGMKQRQDKIPAASKPLLKDTLQRVVTYYQATGQLDRSAQWQKELADPDQK